MVTSVLGVVALLGCAAGQEGMLLGIENIPHQRMEPVRRTLPALKKAGVNLFGRNNLKWSDLEPQAPKGGRHRYDFSALDREFRVYADAGVQLQVTFLCRSSWGTEVPESRLTAEIAGSPPKPAHWESFADVVAALVERYDGDGVDDAFAVSAPLIRVLNIQEEVEFPDHWSRHGGTAESYGRLLATAYQAAKAADPTILVGRAGASVGTLFDVDPDEAAVQAFVRKVSWARQAHEFLLYSLQHPVPYDLFSLHLNRSYTGLEPYVRYVREKMQAAGDVRALMIDDAASINAVRPGEPHRSPESTRVLGWKPGPDLWAHQVRHTVKVAALAAALDVKCLLFTGYTDVPGSPYPQIRHGGFIDSARYLKGAGLAASLKPALHGLGFLHERLRGVTGARFLECDPGACVIRFEAAPHPFLVAWAHAKQTRVELESDATRLVIYPFAEAGRAGGMHGVEVDREPGPMNLEAGLDPVLVELQ